MSKYYRKSQYRIGIDNNAFSNSMISVTIGSRITMNYSVGSRDRTDTSNIYLRDLAYLFTILQAYIYLRSSFAYLTHLDTSNAFC